MTASKTQDTPSALSSFKLMLSVLKQLNACIIPDRFRLIFPSDDDDEQNKQVR